MGAWDQFRLLFWKNFVLQKRRPFATVIELLLPLFFALLLVIIRQEIEVTNYANVTTWSEFSVDNLPEFPYSVVPDDEHFNVAFMPNNVPQIHDIMAVVKQRLNDVPKTRVERKCNIDFDDLRIMLESNGTAVSMLDSLPSGMEQVVDDMAEESNTTSSDMLVSAMLSDNIDELMKNVSTRYMEQTMDCLISEMPKEQRDMMDMFSNNSDADSPSNSNSSDNGSSDAFKSIISFFGIIPKVNLVSFASEDDFLIYVKNDTNLKKTLAGVVFTGDFTNNKFPNDVKITFRFHSDPISSSAKDDARFTGITDTWKTNLLFPDFQLPGPREPKSFEGGKPKYYAEGFLALMHAVDMGLAQVLANTSGVDGKENMFLKRYPYPPYIMDTFVIAIQRTLPLLVMLSFFYTSLVIVRSVVHEKESKMKEYMMMMGLSNWLHWLAWFLKYLIFLAISCIGMAGFYKIQTSKGSVLTYSDVTLVFVFLFAFSAATITLCFLISVFFSKANVAAAAGGVLYGLTYMPYLFMQDNYSNLSHSVKLLSCLLSNVAMSNGCQLLGMFEGKGTGIQWYNIHQGVTVDDSFTLLEVILMLLFDTVLYMVLAVYIEGVWPGEYGIPKKWYFPFMKSYWLDTPPRQKYINIESTGENENEAFNGQSINGTDKEYFEDEPDNLRRVVEIKGLRKVFKSGTKEKVAVDNLSINMYEGQITVLLGHNGAGKTTTMSMLTGFFPPSSGEASIMGHNITDDMKGVRKSLGLCPQFNILFDLLTVDEHLYFFARLKGVPVSEVQQECDGMRDILKLNDKASAQSCTLSGGMKRKLSVGIALSAGSKYVILDEPTSGMDPAARRAIWDVLQIYRTKCSILLSTHFMDEADLLGDRIAIMADGRLRCTGSSVFLKSKFGVGYHVVLTKTPQCDVAQIDRFFLTHVPEAKLERTAGGEVSFVLPFHSSPSFPKLFRSLEEDADNLGITSFGATVTTIEEVFLRVTEDANTALRTVSRRLSFSKSEIVRRPSDADNSPSKSVPSKQYLHSSLKYNSGGKLWLQQFYALLVKRLLHSKRNYKVAISQILVPVFFAIISIINAKYPPFEQKNEPLDLSLDRYGVNNVNLNYTSASNYSTDFGNSYAAQFKDSMELSHIVHGDLESFLATKYQTEGGDFNTANLVSASFISNTTTNNTKAVAWFNNQAYHTPATTLVYMDQAYIRMVAGMTNFTMQVVNYPLPRNSTNRVQEQLLGSLSGFLIAFNIVLGFSFLAASFAIFLVRERVDRSSLLQALAGVDPFCFWLSTFCWDFINFITPCLLTVIMFAVFSVSQFTDHAGIVILLFALYCWASLPLMYSLSLLFQVPSTALVRITIVNIITGLASIITVNVLRILALNDVASSLDWAFLLLPQYCLGQGLADLYTNVEMVNICTSDPLLEIFCKEMGYNFQTNFLAWESYGVGRFVVFLASEGLIFFLILFIVEFDLLPRVWNSLRIMRNATKPMTPDRVSLLEDEDVAEERSRINSSELPNLVATDRLIIKNLRKVYKTGTHSHVAVDKLCIGIPEAECFGLLGINGAGKTTTFKMLTGDYRATSGTAYLDGYDIRTQLRMAQQRMGYCPQFDALIDQMTGAETLRMYARLRGVPEDEIQACVLNLGRILHFSEHIDKACGTYSGGNKRKLSTAIALVGSPPVVLLDEPSTGMDPGAKRMLWDALAAVRSSGCSIVITSHSMEECEALCTRLAIMVNGKLRCMGGPQHLKSKFGEGYVIEVKVKSNAELAKSQIEESFPGSTLKDEHQGMLTYHVPQCKTDGSDLKISMVFELMEESKSQSNIGDYTVSQTSLEQVFLGLVRWQRESTELYEAEPQEPHEPSEPLVA